MRLILEADRIIAEANSDYTGPMSWVEAPEGYVPGSFVLPGFEPVPNEVARYACLMALERHVLVDGQLNEVAAEEPEPQNSLLQQVMALYAAMPPSLEKSKMRDALERVLHWLRTSPSVEAMRLAFGLTHAQVDVLFRWAKAYEATI